MKSIIALVALSLATAGAVAQADTAELRSETVQFADLDTTQLQGAAALYERTKGAAQRVCRNLAPGRSLSLREPYENCVGMALGNAVAAIARPTVTAYAAARGVFAGDGTMRIARRN
jgi:UrcA family protein